MDWGRKPMGDLKSMDTFFNDGVRDPLAGESIESFLADLGLLGQGFAYRELVNGDKRHREPPRHMWPAFAMIVRVAIEFRLRAIMEADVYGIKVAAAYRPAGGASKSAHKYAKALDLDRIGGDANAYFRCAARFWSEHGGKCAMGLGLYTWSTKSLGGIRIHLDVDHVAGLRTWQGVRTRFLRPWNGRPLAYKLLEDMGLPRPTEDVKP